MYHKNAVYIIKDKNDAVRTAKNLLSLGANSISINRNLEHNAYNISFTASDSVIQVGRSGVMYTPAEETFIVTRYLAGLPVGYIAAKTHRKFSGIEAKLQKYGIYLLDNRDPEAVGYATFLYELISLKSIDDSDVETYLPDVYKEIKEKYEFCLDSDDEIDSISEFIVNAESYIEQLRSPEALRPVLAKALHRVLAKALKVCQGFDNTLLAFEHEQFEESGDIKSRLALLRHFDRDDTYFELLAQVDLGIPLDETILLLRDKHSYELNKRPYEEALGIWDTVVTASVWDLTRDQRTRLRMAVTHSEAWQLNINRVHSLANSGSTLASWFLGEISLSKVSRSADQLVNELSDIVISCLSGSLLQNKKAYDYITKNVLSFPEQRIDSYLDKLIKAHRQLQDEMDEGEEIEKPFVIAVASFDRPFSHMAASRPIISALYGLYHDEELTIVNDSSNVISYNVDKVIKSDSVNVPLGYFLNDSYSHVSAVIYSSLATWGKIRALADNPYAHSVYTTFHPNEHSIKPKVRMTHKREYVEHLMDGLYIFHNPFADRPLRRTSFEHFRVAQFFVKDGGELEVVAPDDFLLFRSLRTLNTTE